MDRGAGARRLRKRCRAGRSSCDCRGTRDDHHTSTDFHQTAGWHVFRTTQDTRRRWHSNHRLGTTHRAHIRRS